MQGNQIRKRRHIRLIFAVLAVAMASHGALAQALDDKFDRFTGARVISYTQPGTAAFGKPQLAVQAEQRDGETIALMRFMSSPPLGRYTRQEMEYLGCRSIDWLVDGVPLSLGSAVHTMRHYHRLLVEFMTQPVTLQQLRAIGAATRAEYRICTKEGALTSSDIASIRELANRLAPAPDAPAGGSED